ncbi:non-ribosomal peptide synthetase [Phytohabitans houttuyneae]|uniref:non-ribosomal peptide synthetase n=1 Tax=Phytohabitans houttuyneae TaxID=1076126 RepID=UPI001FE51CDE|nr:amino acid adenylation domain-containing protein [Phytohabitans houttuyneae]
MRTSAAIDLTVLAAAVRELMRRYPVLRTTFPARDGVPARHLAPVGDPPVTGEVVAPDDLPAALAAATRRAFDLTTDLPFRVHRFALTGGGSVLMLVGHHIAVDGQSGGRLVPELCRIYQDLLDGGPSGAAPEAEQLREAPPSEGSLAYWTERLSGLDPRQLALGRARPDPDTPSFSGGRMGRDLTDATRTALHALRRQLRVTENMALLAGFYALLARHGAGPDLVVALPVSTRGDAGHAAVGYHVNTLPLRVRVDLGAGFRHLAGQVRDELIAGLAHADTSFESVLSEVRLDGAGWRAPLFRHMFNFHPPAVVGPAGHLPDAAWHPVDAGLTRHDLHVAVFHRTERLDMQVEYSTEIHDPEYIADLVERYELLLRAAAADPDRPLSTLDLWRPHERALVVPPPPEDTSALPGALAARLAEPAAPALVEVDGTVRDRGWLAGRAASIRRHLAAAGVGAGDVVALAAPRGGDLAAAVLAVWSLRAAYQPVDPAQPAARTAAQLDDARARAVVLATGELPAGAAEGRAVLRLDLVPEAHPSTQDLVDGLRASGGDDLAYVIFTSGSTGQPKGVEIAHAALANLVRFFAGHLGLRGHERVLWLTTFGFDISALELLLPLCHAGTAVVAPPEAQTDPRLLLDLVTRHDVAVVQTTPTIWRLVANRLGDELAGRTVLCGGEPLSATLAARLLRSGCRLFNVYGPTETTIWSTVAEIAPDVTDPVGVGRPIAGTALHILDAHGQPVPPGVVGELCIGGTGVARGYAGRPELTAERFRTSGGVRLYHTGDLATWRRDGTVELLGRADRQVKLRGRRIELGEVEAALERHPGVTAAAVVVQGDPQGDGRLIGYLQGPAAPDEVAAHARSVLPYYLVPADLVTLDALPRNPSGKVDYRALPAVVATAPASARAETSDPLVAELVDLWTDLLGAPDLGPHSNFFTSGGHSLLAAILVTRIAGQIGREVSLPELFAAPTPAELARELRNGR